MDGRSGFGQSSKMAPPSLLVVVRAWHFSHAFCLRFAYCLREMRPRLLCALWAWFLVFAPFRRSPAGNPEFAMTVLPPGSCTQSIFRNDLVHDTTAQAELHQMTTYSAVDRESAIGTLFDASSKVLGRLASEIARRLKGKHKPMSDHVDTGTT